MNIKVLLEARKKTQAAPEEKEEFALSKIPDELGKSFGDEINAHVKDYIEKRVDKGLYRETMIGQIPDSVIFFVFDTETTGLNMEHDDVITEIACLAYDKKFEKIDEYHATVKLPEEKDPEVFMNRTYNNIERLGLSKEEFLQILHSAEEYVKDDGVEDYGEKEMSYTIMMKIFNHIKGNNESKIPFNMTGLSAQDKELCNKIYRIIRPLMKGANIKKVLKMTKYGEIQAGTHEQDEKSMVDNFISFIHKVVAVKKGIPVLVAHNYPYDHKMMRQAFTRADKAYEHIKFVDTAQLTRYYAYRYSYLMYMYAKLKIEKTKSGEHLKDVFTHHPMGNARMGTLAQHFKIPNLNWHTAKNDVEATAQILKYLFAIDVYYKDFINKKSITDEDFDEIKAAMDLKQEEHQYGVDRETGERKRLDWFSPLNNRFMSAHQADFAEFTDKIKNTNLYLQHFREISSKYLEKIKAYALKNDNKKIENNYAEIERDLHERFAEILQNKSPEARKQYVEGTAALLMKTLKDANIGPKDYIYYAKETGMNYKRYILMTYVREFAEMLGGDMERIGELSTLMSGMEDMYKDTQITARKTALDKFLNKEENEDLKNSDTYKHYINDIGSAETHYEKLLGELTTTKKELTPEFVNDAEKHIDEDEMKALEKFLKAFNVRKSPGVKFKGDLWDKYSNYYIDNDYIRGILHEEDEE